MAALKIIRVTARMGSQLVLTAPLHLDGLLSAVHPATHGHQRPTRSDETDEHIRIAPLPLGQVFYGGSWVWAASAAQMPDEATLRVSTITKRRDPGDVYYAQRQFQPASGPMRDRMVAVQTVCTPSMSFLAVSNDVPDVRRLLRRVMSVGGLRKNGYGQVLSWDVDVADISLGIDAWRETIINDGRARRRLPAEILKPDTYRDQQLRAMPPYWCRAGLVWGVEVGDECELRDEVMLR